LRYIFVHFVIFKGDQYETKTQIWLHLINAVHCFRGFTQSRHVNMWHTPSIPEEILKPPFSRPPRWNFKYTNHPTRSHANYQPKTCTADRDCGKQTNQQKNTVL